MMMRLFLVLSMLLGLNAYADDIDLDKIVVTPNRYAISDRSLSSNISVISSQDMKRVDAKTIADVIRNVPGILLSDNSSIKTQIVDIRAGGEFANRNTLVLIDGRKVNPVDISGPDWLQIPTDVVERVEIIRGAGSVLYGDNAPSGVINIITKRSTKGTHGSAGFLVGSFDTHREFMQVSSGNDKVDILVHVGQMETDGYRNNSQVNAKDALITFGLRPVDVLDFDLGLNWHEDHYGLPGALLQTDLNTLGRRATTKSEDYGDTRDRSVHLTSTFTPSKEEGNSKFIIENSYRNRDSYGYYFSQGADTKYNIDTYGLTGKYVFSQQDVPHSIDVVTGVDWVSNNNKIKGGQFSSDILTISKDDLGFFVNGEYQILEQLYINAGSRYQQSLYTFDVSQDSSSSSPSFTRSRPNVQVSRGGLRFQYAKDSNLFADIEQTFRFLATDEMYSSYSGLDLSLEQQQGLQFQSGIKHSWFDVAQTKLTGYRIDNRNEIFFNPSLGGGFGLNSNYDRTLRHGIELEQSFDVKKMIPQESFNIFDSWQAGLNMVWQKAEFARGEFKDKRIPLTASFQNSLFTTIGFARSWVWRFDWRYIGNRYRLNDENNTLDPLKPYGLVDTRLSYTYHHIEIFGSIDNIFDQKYYSFAGKGTNSNNLNYYPSQQRTFTTGIKIKF